MWKKKTISTVTEWFHITIIIQCLNAYVLIIYNDTVGNQPQPNIVPVPTLFAPQVPGSGKYCSHFEHIKVNWDNLSLIKRQIRIIQRDIIQTVFTNS